MKKVFLTLLFCSFVAQCFALTPMTDENMMKAIQYGVASKQDKQTLYQSLAYSGTLFEKPLPAE